LQPPHAHSTNKPLTHIPGNVIQDTPYVRRVLAPNPGIMTGSGTNTYIIGRGEVAIIDPGPIHQTHLKAILKATENEKISCILSTHTHHDHSPGTVPLIEAIQKRQSSCTLAHTLDIIGLPAPTNDGHTVTNHDDTFQPTILPKHGALIPVGPLTLEVIYTPGHASNHICYLLQEEKLLFTGDHIMDGTTVVIAPPDGNMSAYLDSLALLNTYDISAFAPAHGNLIHTPKKTVDATIAHRLKREKKVIEGLKLNPNSTLEALVPLVYEDTPTFLHPIALFSLEAHLLKLKAENRAQMQSNYWRLT
jgi:glyoxylase-like metal-dependent hydrolase (beta-lactamase superfamily II)